MVFVAKQLVSANAGQDVLLECHTEAYPASINYWTNERGDMIVSGNSETFYRRVSISCFISADTSQAGDKFEAISTNSGYNKVMKLKIRDVGPNDFGSYHCVAKNSLGKNSRAI